MYTGSRLLSTITKTGSTETTEYHHPDRLGTKLIANPATNTVKEQETLPYGTSLDAETTTPQANNGVGPSNQRFTSYDRSGTTGLDYAVNRIYSSEQGRFTQPDPIGMASVDLTDPQTLNLYTYARNNPIDFTGPDGLHPRYMSGGFDFNSFSSMYAFWGSKIVDLPGFGTEWGSLSEFSLVQYEERVENAFSGRGFLTDEEYTEQERRASQDAGVIATVDVYWTNGSYEFGRQDFRDINLANLIRGRAGANHQSGSGGDWRVRALVRGGLRRRRQRSLRSMSLQR